MRLSAKPNRGDSQTIYVTKQDTKQSTFWPLQFKKGQMRPHKRMCGCHHGASQVQVQNRRRWRSRTAMQQLNPGNLKLAQTKRLCSAALDRTHELRAKTTSLSTFLTQLVCSSSGLGSRYQCQPSVESRPIVFGLSKFSSHSTMSAKKALLRWTRLKS
jgi:hypothetical protein